jgi:hypothetical protein
MQHKDSSKNTTDNMPHSIAGRNHEELAGCTLTKWTKEMSRTEQRERLFNRFLSRQTLVVRPAARLFLG